MELDLERIYQYRFDGISAATKAAVWRRIASWILRDAIYCRSGELVRSILDPACGEGEFLNACCNRGLHLSGCDLRPRSALLSPEVQFHQGKFQEISLEKSYDLIWISNLLEHLPSPEAVQSFLSGCRATLTPGGIITIMGPNIKYCAEDYWDFADHLLPLSHLTVLEHLISAGLEIVAVQDRFLPYSFRSRLPTHPRLVQLYLNSSWAWPWLGKQFLIRAALPKR
jgi:2-polyprenyl-3-methyl-5-hydroxy-6-metoxy-1,4-benzoquinol methylase